jgi:hypothetical protein
MAPVYCGQCGSTMLQAADGTAIYHLCPHCKYSVVVVVPEYLMDNLPGLIMSDEEREMIDQIDAYWLERE